MIPIVWASAWVAAAAPIEGRVMERGDGIGLSEALLRAHLPDGTEAQVEVDLEGRFRVDWPAGTPVTVLAAGHVPLDTQVPEEGPWNLFLARGSGGAEVVVEARRDDPVVSEQKLDRERVLQTPGTHEDPIRLVQSLPGVSQTPEYSPRAGDISVRGALPGDNRYLFDGIDLPYLYHFNQYSSVFHTRLLDELTLYPSTFGASFGGANGAILDTHSVWNHPDRVRASVNLNLIMGGGEIDVPLADAWTLRASARRSYYDLISPSSLQYTVFPIFSDGFARLEHELPNGTRLAVVTIGAHDYYERYAGEPTLLDPYESAVNPVLAHQQGFSVVAVQHTGAGPRGSVTGSLSFTGYEQSDSLPEASARRLENTIALREDGVAIAGPHARVALGVEVRDKSLYLNVATDRAWSEVARESPLLARGVADAERLHRTLAGVYLEPRIDVGTLRIIPGVRLDGDTLSHEATLDPRLGLRWHPAKDTNLRAAVGLYSEFATPEQLSPVLGTPGLAPERSAQVAFGADQTVAGRLELGVDAWAKSMWDLVQDQTGAAPLTGLTGKAAGVSLTSRYRIRDVFFTWVSLDLAKSTREKDGVVWPSDYDQPYALNVVASWTFRPTWNVGIRYRLSAGLPYTPIAYGVYNPVADTYTPVDGPTNSERLPSYQKFDLHVEKRFELRRVTITPYLEAWYVPAANNVMYLAWNYDYSQSAEVHGPSFLPLVGVRGEL